MNTLRYNTRINIEIVFGILCISSIAAYLFSSPEFSTELSKEHGVVENLSALCYFTSFVLCVIAIALKKGRYFAWLWLVLSFLFFGEETNWLQNWIQYDIPFYEQLADTEKSEFALHNFKSLEGEGHNFLNEDGSVNFAMEYFLKAQTLFKMGFFLYFFLLPIAMLRREIRDFLTGLGIPPFNLTAWIIMWSVLALTVLIPIWIKMHGGNNEPYFELRELFYSMFILYHITGFFLSKPAREEIRAGVTT